MSALGMAELFDPPGRVALTRIKRNRRRFRFGHWSTFAPRAPVFAVGAPPRPHARPRRNYRNAWATFSAAARTSTAPA